MKSGKLMFYSLPYLQLFMYAIWWENKNFCTHACNHAEFISENWNMLGPEGCDHYVCDCVPGTQSFSLDNYFSPSDDPSAHCSRKRGAFEYSGISC